jgi:hypothetical protein
MSGADHEAGTQLGQLASRYESKESAEMQMVAPLRATEI